MASRFGTVTESKKLWHTPCVVVLRLVISKSCSNDTPMSGSSRSEWKADTKKTLGWLQTTLKVCYSCRWQCD